MALFIYFLSEVKIIINFIGEKITNLCIGKQNRNTLKWSEFDYYLRSGIFLFGGIGILYLIAVMFDLGKEFIVYYCAINLIRCVSGGYHSYRVPEFCWIVTAFNFTSAGLLCKLTYPISRVITVVCIAMALDIIRSAPVMRPQDKKRPDDWYRIYTGLVLMTLGLIGGIYSNTFVLNCINWSIIMVWATMLPCVIKRLEKISNKLFRG